MRGRIAQVKGLFEGEPEGFRRGVEGLKTGNSASSYDAGLPGTSILPVLPALAGLLPGGGLARGSVLAVDHPGLLCLALLAGASAAGAWCGVAGVASLGVVAAAGMGAEPGRLMLVPEPGPGWPQVVASMLEACEVVVVRPPDPPSGQVRRRLEGVLRRGGGVLGAGGGGARVGLRLPRRSWAGRGAAPARWRACRAEVLAEGRGAAARPRRQWLWLPGPDGTVTVDETAAARPAGPARATRRRACEDGRRGPSGPDPGRVVPGLARRRCRGGYGRRGPGLRAGGHGGGGLLPGGGGDPARVVCARRPRSGP